MYNLLQETLLFDVLEEISQEKIPPQSKAHHEPFGREHMTSILFDVGLRMDNGEDLWTGVKLNPELHCPHDKIAYQLTRRGAIVHTWRDEWASPGFPIMELNNPSEQ